MQGCLASSRSTPSSMIALFPIQLHQARLKTFATGSCHFFPVAALPVNLILFTARCSVIVLTTSAASEGGHDITSRTLFKIVVLPVELARICRPNPKYVRSILGKLARGQDRENGELLCEKECLPGHYSQYNATRLLEGDVALPIPWAGTNMIENAKDATSNPLKHLYFQTKAK